MLRLLPYRQYHDIDVINMFALEDGSVNENVTGVGSGDNGVFVKVTTGDFNADPVAYGADSYLGKTDYPHVGFNQYPKVAKKVAPAASGEAALVLGITLSQTAKYDENGEKLSYYPAKAADLHAVLPGQAVPIATRGIFTISANAFDGSISGGDYAIGTGLTISDNGGGKVTGVAPSDASAIATVLGTGSRTSQTNTDQFAGEYLVIKLK
jgi:hypothetical protein